jgi:hypothetical protein
MKQHGLQGSCPPPPPAHSAPQTSTTFVALETHWCFMNIHLGNRQSEQHGAGSCASWHHNGDLPGACSTEADPLHVSLQLPSLCVSWRINSGSCLHLLLRRLPCNFPRSAPTLLPVLQLAVPSRWVMRLTPCHC